MDHLPALWLEDAVTGDRWCHNQPWHVVVVQIKCGEPEWDAGGRRGTNRGIVFGP